MKPVVEFAKVGARSGARGMPVPKHSLKWSRLMDAAIASILEARTCPVKRARRAFTPEFKQEGVQQITEAGGSR